MLEAGRARLLATGQFEELRNQVGMRGKESEMHMFLNALQSMHGEYATEDHALYPALKDFDVLALEYFDSERGSVEFYEDLFEIAKRAGFTYADRLAMEKYFSDIELASNERIFDPNTESDEWSRTRKHLQSAREALDHVFPRHNAAIE